MRQLGAILIVAVLLVGLAAPAAHAGGGTAANVALGLASFAVFNQLFAPAFYPRPVYAAPVYVAPPPYQVVYAPPVYAAPPTPPPPRVVYYPHGRYELMGDGITTAYQWVWIPTAPPPPPVAYQQPSVSPPPPPAGAPPPGPSAGAPCKPTGKYVKTPQGLLPECE